MSKAKTKENQDAVEQPQTAQVSVQDELQPVQEAAEIDPNTKADADVQAIPGEPEPVDSQVPDTDTKAECQEPTVGITAKSIKSTISKMIDVLSSEPEAVTAAAVEKPVEEARILAKRTIVEQRRQIAKDVFADHTDCKVLYFTDDLVPFFQQSDANRHAATLQTDTVITVNRE